MAGMRKYVFSRPQPSSLGPMIGHVLLKKGMQANVCSRSRSWARLQVCASLCRRGRTSVTCFESLCTPDHAHPCLPALTRASELQKNGQDTGKHREDVPHTCRSGVHTHMTNTRITDPEILERRYPVVLRSFSLRHGSGGEGEHPGGDGVIREVRADACGLGG